MRKNTRNPGSKRQASNREDCRRTAFSNGGKAKLSDYANRREVEKRVAQLKRPEIAEEHKIVLTVLECGMQVLKQCMRSPSEKRHPRGAKNRKGRVATCKSSFAEDSPTVLKRKISPNKHVRRLERVDRTRVFKRNDSSGGVRSYLDSIGDIGILPADEDKQLVRLAQEGDVKARNAVVLSNLKLVAAIAKHYKNRGLPMLDLLQEGNIGLMRAIDKFRPESGNKFSTYASWWIREAITRALSNKSRTIRLPVHVTEFLTTLRRIRGELAIRLGRTPTTEDIAEAMNQPEKKVRQLLEASQACLSLEQKAPGVDDDDCTIGATVEDESLPALDSSCSAEFVQKEVGQLLAVLDDRERRVVQLRFGLGTGQSRSLREVSKVLGLTRNQVGKLSCRAMRKLKEAASDRELQSYLV